jgi:hypothetical protein
MGSSSKNTDQQQQSISQPWQPAQGALTGILSQLNPGNAQLNPNEQAGIQGLQNTAGYLSQYLPQLGANTSSLLAGGNAQAQAPMINQAYQQYQSQLNPYLQSSFLDPRNTPGFADALAATNADITQQINGQFAGAGRSGSGYNAQTLARGLSQGEGQLLANQYNQNVANQLGAAGSLYGAGNTTGGLLTGLQQQALANQQAGIGSAQAGQQFATSPWQQLLTAGQLQQQIPLQYLQGLAGTATPIAGLGGQTQQQGVSTQTGTQPLAQTIGQLGQGLGSFLWGGGNNNKGLLG